MIKIIKSNKNKLMEDSISKEDSKTNNTKNSKELNTKIQTSKINDKSPTKNGSKKDDEDDDFVLPVKTIKRSNSIKLYKKHQKDKATKLNVRKDSKKNTKGGDIFDGAEEDGTKRPNKSTKNVGQKKVVFPPPGPPTRCRTSPGNMPLPSFMKCANASTLNLRTSSGRFLKSVI